MNTRKAFTPEAIDFEPFEQNAFHSKDSSNPFRPLSKEQIFADLAVSRREAAEGKGIDMEEALMDMGQQHGFI